jgi:FKBP-type peptidyl-prolyl cis-trans isomerase
MAQDVPSDRLPRVMGGARLFAVVLVAALVPGCTADSSSCNEGERVELEGGLVYTDTECGDGAEALSGAELTVQYTGELESGKVFDSSRESGSPFTFVLGAEEVIQGWDEGLRGMLEGGSRRLVVPPELGYGEEGSPPDIPGGATLIFDIELLEVEFPE